MASSEFPILSASPKVRIAHGARRGAVIGLYLAFVFSAVLLVRGEGLPGLPQFARAVAAFVTGGTVAGAILLVYQRRVRDTWGAILLATACNACIVAAFVIAAAGFHAWTIAGVVFGGVVALLLGVISGVIVWHRLYRHSSG